MTKKSAALIQFQEASYHLVAIRILGDYVEARHLMPVEPEHFVEDWVTKHIIKPPALMKRSIWRYFLKEWQMYLRKKRCNE